MAILYTLKVFDGSISGVGGSPNPDSNVVYTPAELNRELAQAEKWFVFVRVTQGSGTGPTMSVVLEHSNDNVNWTTKTTFFNAQQISTSSIGTYYADDTGTTNVGGAFMRLKISLGGTSPSANLQVWLTGRSND